MNKKWVILLGACIVILAAVAIFLTLRGEKQTSVAVTYELIESRIENSNAVIKFKASVSGEGAADPITYVRLVDANGFSIYPLTGHLKQEIAAGNSEEYEFSFPFPSTINCTLEIHNSSGDLQNIGVHFPEVESRDKTIKADDTLVGVGESFTKDDAIKYTINEYHFTTAGGKEIAPDGYQYLILTIAADNVLTDTSIEIANSFFTLKNSEDVDVNGVDVAAAGGSEALDKILGPGEQMTGQVAFLVPKADGDLFLYFKGEKIFKIISD